jgi:hypothetical protein
MPTDARFCGTECRVANAVMAVRAAWSLPVTSALLVVVRSGLDEVLLHVVDGSYIPSMTDALVALEFARDSAESGCLASEVAPLIQVGIAAMHGRLLADRSTSAGAVSLGRSLRVKARTH